MRQRRRKPILIKSIALVLVAGLLLFIGALPLLETQLQSGGTSLHRIPGYETIQRIRTGLMETLVAAWFFALGSMVGSFANVVVYRMPLGKSVIASPSACPYCHTRIRLTDNIPIIGWIKLKGRCRTCRLPISGRYPLVELLFGLVFALLFAVELASGGANLPFVNADRRAGILSLFIEPPWLLLGIFALHCTLMTLLLIWALMSRDHHRIPIRTIAFALVVGGVCTIIWPDLHPLKWTGGGEPWFLDIHWLARVDTGFIGLSSGFILGGLLDPLLITADPSGFRPRAAVSIGLMTAGLFLGWQSVTTIALLLGAFCLGEQSLRAIGWRSSSQVGPAGWLAAATLLHLCLWQLINGLVLWSGSWAGAAGGWMLYAGCGLIAVGVSWMSYRVASRTAAAETES